jgi:hypothetical protein
MAKIRQYICPAILLVALSASPAFAQTSDGNAGCLVCHSAPGLSKKLPDGKILNLHVDEDNFRQSIHGKRLCTDCHADPGMKVFPHKQPVSQVKCAKCHFMGNPVGAPTFGPIAVYTDSVHGRAAERGDPDAPRCKDCHGTHNILRPDDPKSTVNRKNVPATCARCHADLKLAKRHNIPAVSSYEVYKHSVHAKMIGSGGPAAVCIDCHGSHGIKSAADPMSSVNRQNIPTTCGKCHLAILSEYRQGIHGQAMARGVKDAPVCTSCHGEHNIQKPTDRNSTVYPTHVVATCSKCHEDQRIQREYGLPSNRLGTYSATYHGIANKFGEPTVANCSTCHGSHLILPSSDPRSSVNKTNLPNTCGKCHPGATGNFAKATVHAVPSPKHDIALYWVGLAYKFFITGMISSFVGYIMLDLISRVRRRSRRA